VTWTTHPHRPGETPQQTYKPTDIFFSDGPRFVVVRELEEDGEKVRLEREYRVVAETEADGTMCALVCFWEYHGLNAADEE